MVRLGLLGWYCLDETTQWKGMFPYWILLVDTWIQNLVRYFQGLDHHKLSHKSSYRRGLIHYIEKLLPFYSGRLRAWSRNAHLLKAMNPCSVCKRTSEFYNYMSSELSESWSHLVCHCRQRTKRCLMEPHLLKRPSKSLFHWNLAGSKLTLHTRFHWFYSSSYQGRWHVPTKSREATPSQAKGNLWLHQVQLLLQSE